MAEQPNPNGATANKEAALAAAYVTFGYGEAAIDAAALAPIEIGGAHANEPAAHAPSDDGFLLSHLSITLENIVGAPTELTMLVSWDQSRDHVVSASLAVPLVAGTTAGRSSLVANFGAPGVPLRRPTGAGTANRFWIHLQMDAGTSADARIWSYYRPARARR